MASFPLTDLSGHEVSRWVIEMLSEAEFEARLGHRLHPSESRASSQIPQKTGDGSRACTDGQMGNTLLNHTPDSVDFKAMGMTPSNVPVCLFSFESILTRIF